MGAWVTAREVSFRLALFGIVLVLGFLSAPNGEVSANESLFRRGPVHIGIIVKNDALDDGFVKYGDILYGDVDKKNIESRRDSVYSRAQNFGIAHFHRVMSYLSGSRYSEVLKRTSRVFFETGGRRMCYYGKVACTSVGWGLAAVLDMDDEFGQPWVSLNGHFRVAGSDVGPELAPSGIFGHIDRVLGRLNGLSCVLSGISRRTGSTFSVAESTPKQDQAGKRKSHSNYGCPEHALCPPRHTLLGIQIAYFVIGGGLALGLSFVSYVVANRGLDLFEGRRNTVGGLVFCLTVIFGPASVGLVLYGGYWITYLSGWFPVLS